VSDFLDPSLPTACTPLLKLKECKLPNKHKHKDSRDATEVTKFIETIQGKNTLQKFYFIMHHLKKALKLKFSPHVVSSFSAVGCSSCVLLFFALCTLLFADPAETNLGSVCMFVSSDGVFSFQKWYSSCVVVREINNL